MLESHEEKKKMSLHCPLNTSASQYPQDLTSRIALNQISSKIKYTFNLLISKKWTLDIRIRINSFINDDQSMSLKKEKQRIILIEEVSRIFKEHYYIIHEFSS